MKLSIEYYMTDFESHWKTCSEMICENFQKILWTESISSNLKIITCCQMWEITLSLLTMKNVHMWCRDTENVMIFIMQYLIFFFSLRERLSWKHLNFQTWNCQWLFWVCLSWQNCCLKKENTFSLYIYHKLLKMS